MYTRLDTILLAESIEKVGRACSPRTVARRHVVDDGALVAVGPGVPEDLQGIAGLGLDVGLTRRGALMTGDVRGAEAVRFHEAVVLVHGPPARRVGGLASGQVVPVRVGTLDDTAAVDRDARHMAVSRSEAE